eukprot:164893_1
MSQTSPNEDSTGGVGGTSLLSSMNSNHNLMDDDPFHSYRSKSPFGGSVSSFASLMSSMDSEARNLNVHLLQGNVDRSWIDPWEMTPHPKFYQKNYESPTRHLVATSILPNSFLTPPSSIEAIVEHTDQTNTDALDSPLLSLPTETDIEINMQHTVPDAKSKSSKFGPWDGVMTGALLNIWGVILFLRFGWIICQAGIIGTILIILLSTMVTTLTTISMSAICTNGTVKAGGAYYIISRTIGPEWGGSVGMILSIGSMLAVSLYLIGFAESLATNLDTQADFHVFADPTNDIRMWATVFLLIVLILAVVGLKYVIKAQILLLVWIVFSIICLMIGCFYRTSLDPQIDGVMSGFKLNFKDNLWSHYHDGYNFWTVLAIFFPAVTGIMAGANLSGDLRDPSKDIPKGTFVAIGVSSTTYIVLAILIGSTAPRDSLCSNPLIMTNIVAINDYIIYIATYAATISSAIASLVGAPRILMAVGQDKILNIPKLNVFTKANREGNPIRGYYLTAFVALCVNAIGSINAIAPLISLFFIMVYLLINFSCFIMEISKSPGWRPGFKYFSAWTAIAGALVCAVVMFLLDPIYALCTVSIALFFYIYVAVNDPDVAWGGAFHSRAIYKTYRALLNLALRDKKSEFNWRPSFLVIAFGRQYSLTKYVETLRKCHSLIFSCSIYKENYRQSVIKKLDEQLAMKRRSTNLRGLGMTRNDHSYVSLKDGYLPIRSFSHKRMKYGGKRSLGFNDAIVTDGSYRNAMQTVLQNSGLGALRPNTLILNLLRLHVNEEEEDAEEEEEKQKHEIECNEYVEILRDSLLYGYGVMVCHGLCDTEKYHKIDWSLHHCFENIIDVWWIADDGGLILLIPYIMCLCTYWNKCKVRINLIKERYPNNTSNLGHNNKRTESDKIQSLIHKFRLNKIYNGEPRIIEVDNHNPSKRTIHRFEKLSKTKIKNATRQNVMLRWLKLSELLNEYSKQSVINVVTLPVPTSHIKPSQYVAILHLLSDQNTLPPTIIMRGNGEQTLTFYSE